MFVPSITAVTDMDHLCDVFLTMSLLTVSQTDLDVLLETACL